MHRRTCTHKIRAGPFHLEIEPAPPLQIAGTQHPALHIHDGDRSTVRSRYVNVATRHLHMEFYTRHRRKARNPRRPTRHLHLDIVHVHMPPVLDDGEGIGPRVERHLHRHILKGSGGSTQVPFKRYREFLGFDLRPVYMDILSLGV